MTEKSKSPKTKKALKPVAVSPVLWECPSHIYAVAEEQDLHAVLRKHGIPPSRWLEYLGGPDSEMAASLAEVQYYEGGALIVVCFGPSLFREDTAERIHSSVMTTILHEAVHVFQRICDLVGEDDPGREVEAYAIETITRNLTDAFMALQGQLHAIKQHNHADPQHDGETA